MAHIDVSYLVEERERRDRAIGGPTIPIYEETVPKFNPLKAILSVVLNKFNVRL